MSKKVDIVTGEDCWERIHELWDIVKSLSKKLKGEISLLKDSRNELLEELSLLKEKEREREDQESRVRKLEWKVESNERQRKRKNLIMRGVDTSENEDKVKERVREVLGIIQEGIIPEVVKVCGRVAKEGRVLIKFKSEEDRNIMRENRHKLKGRKERVEKDLTWWERRTQWELRKLAAELEREGNSVKVMLGMIWIDGKWWKWMDVSRDLRDFKGTKWMREKEIEEMDIMECTIVGE